jgi:hypothetical protein
MANIHISTLSKELTSISQVQLTDVNGGAIALPSFLNQANKARSTKFQPEGLGTYLEVIALRA